MAGHELPVTGHESLLQLAASIEGHPDNVAPAIYGGLQLGIHTQERWLTRSTSSFLFFHFFLSSLFSFSLLFPLLTLDTKCLYS